tara:strand:- start:93 stop:488 length:396 start_codon:yes stop_codon:yes gene_type:complete
MTNSITAITTKFAPSPVGPYSQATIANGWLYCSGQIALDPSTGEMVGKNNIEEETRQVLVNLIAVLNAAGANSKNVVKTTIYLTDLNDFAKVNQVYEKIFNESVSPARACIEVSALPKGGRVEIDCVAYLN